MALGVVTLLLLMGTQAYGQPKVDRFYNGAEGAVSLQFDDSMISQLHNALPVLNERGIRATFFINPARPQHQAHLHEWEVEVPKAGHEIANHTLHHSGAKNAEEAESEISQCSVYMRKIYGSKPRLESFGQPGGVPWTVSQPDLDKIFHRYLLIPSVNRLFFDEKQTDPVKFARDAMEHGSWSQIGMHGVGGEWLSTSVPTLTHLLDFLVANRSRLWVAPTIEVYKYIQERNAAGSPVVTRTTDRGFSVKVDCDSTKLDTFGFPVSKLYDQPLTVEVSVPSSWNSYTVKQGKRKSHGTVKNEGEVSAARFEVLPNVGPARVEMGLG